jgi:hypothetical protein
MEVNIETHPLIDRVLSALQVPLTDVMWVKDNMPTRAIMDDSIHGWQHVLHMLVYASALCQYADFDIAVVRWSILLHDSGRYSEDTEETVHGLMSAWVFGQMCKKATAVGQSITVDEEQVIGIVGRHSMTDSSISTEEAVVRTCDRLDLYRLPGFERLNPELMEAPGWSKVAKIARELRGG